MKILKVLCLTMVLVLMLSCTAMAATVQLDTPQVDKTAKTAVVSGKIVDPAESSQVTIVVIESSKSLSSVASGDIVYVDQMALEADGTFSFSLAVNQEKFKGDQFKAYIGGTGVTTVSSATLNFGSTLKGDVTGDGKVSLLDYQLVVANFGKTTSKGDANGDGKVSLTDYQLVVANFGKTSASE